MNQKSKKILIILAVILGITLIGLLVYYFFFKKTTPPAVPIIETPSLGGENAPQAKERLVPITDETVLAAGLFGSAGTTTESGPKIIYAAWDGSINQIDFNGQNKNKVGLAAVDRIGEVKVSPVGDLVSFKYFLATGAAKYLVYDVNAKTLKTLPTNVSGISLGRNGDFVFLNGAKINSSLADLSKTKDLAVSKIPDLVLDWYSDNSLALETKPSGTAQGILYLLDLKTRKTKRVLGGVYGLTAKFSPKGGQVLVSETSADGRSLRITSINLAKKTQRNLNLFTLPEKCAWSKDERTVFCAVFKVENLDNFIMPDDYYKRRIRSDGEKIARINLETGQVKNIIENIFDATNLFLAPDENYLFFVNKTDGRLYRLTL